MSDMSFSIDLSSNVKDVKKLDEPMIQAEGE